ncbi:RICIN domain-containing protein [Actinoplanes sp. NPDC023801]|uniref:RICIN domain-containing protein n=1 Tax=Actinoplanes sp. NPDC023801 TaxID=3154595 RepID=UPI00340F5B64
MPSRSVSAALLVVALLSGLPAVPAVAVPGPPPLLQGWIVTRGTAYRCLTGGPIGTVVHTSGCVRGNGAQLFYQTSEGHLTQGDNCLQPHSAGAKVLVKACTYRSNQNWWISTTVRAGTRAGLCLTELAVDRSNVGKVRLRDCTGGFTQNWRSLTPW